MHLKYSLGVVVTHTKQAGSMFLRRYFSGNGKRSSPKISKLPCQDWTASYLLLAKNQKPRLRILSWNLARLTRFPCVQSVTASRNRNSLLLSGVARYLHLQVEWKNLKVPLFSSSSVPGLWRVLIHAASPQGVGIMPAEGFRCFHSRWWGNVNKCF